MVNRFAHGHTIICEHHRGDVMLTEYICLLLISPVLTTAPGSGYSPETAPERSLTSSHDSHCRQGLPDTRMCSMELATGSPISEDIHPPRDMPRKMTFWERERELRATKMLIAPFLSFAWKFHLRHG